MIIDRIENLTYYKALLPRVETYQTLLADWQQCKNGKVTLEHEDYALYQATETRSRDSVLFEAHEQYGDLHVVLAGSEVVEWQDIQQLTCVQPYDAEKEAAAYSGQGVCIKIEPGMFYFVAPQDGHKPCLYLDEANQVEKVIIKVKL